MSVHCHFSIHLQRCEHSLRRRGEHDRGRHTHASAFCYLRHVLEPGHENRLPGALDRQRKLAHAAFGLARPAYRDLLGEVTTRRQQLAVNLSVAKNKGSAVVMHECTRGMCQLQSRSRP